MICCFPFPKQERAHVSIPLHKNLCLKAPHRPVDHLNRYIAPTRDDDDDDDDDGDDESPPNMVD